jgi:glutathione-regulated potassium-efflux system ancillary protein KefF
VARSITVVYCHPYPNRSRANRILLDGVRDLSGVDVRSLYALYPDFDIDAQAEQRALADAQLIVWQGPFYWYGVPALLSLWFEKVLTQGWAYGEGANALRGKSVLWVATTGSPLASYRRGAMHGHPFEEFVPPISQIARFCGMQWVDPPLILHSAHRMSDLELREVAQRYRGRIEALVSRVEEGTSHG